MRAFAAIAAAARRVLAWLFGSRRRALPAPRGSAWGHADDLPDDLRVELDAFAPPPGVIRDTVAGALRDFRDLREVVAGPGAGGSGDDLFDDAELLADAQTLLRDIINRAPDVQALVEIAGTRRTDRDGREAAGDAVLRLRDDARTLSRAASFAIRWAADKSDDAKTGLRECAQTMRAQA